MQSYSKCPTVQQNTAQHGAACQSDIMIARTFAKFRIACVLSTAGVTVIAVVHDQAPNVVPSQYSLVGATQ